MMKILIPILSVLLIKISCDEPNKNILLREISNTKIQESDTQSSVFIIKDEILKFFNQDESINIYVSVTNFYEKNYLHFKFLHDEYFSRYNLLLGRTEKYYQFQKSTAKPFHYFVENNTKIIYDNFDDIFLGKVTFNDSLNIYFVKNQYISHLDNITSHLKVFEFYDLNILYNLNQSQKLYILDTIENVYYFKNYTSENICEIDFIEKEISNNNTYDFIFEFSSVNLKIKRLNRIKDIMNKIMSRSDINMDLMNYLLFSHIDVIKSQLLNIQQYFLPLYYYNSFYTEEEFNLKIEILEQKIDNLTNYLDSFDFTKGDFGINFCYLSFIFIILLITSFFIYKTVIEFKIAYQRKTV